MPDVVIVQPRPLVREVVRDVLVHKNFIDLEEVGPTQDFSGFLLAADPGGQIIQADGRATSADIQVN